MTRMLFSRDHHIWLNEEGNMDMPTITPIKPVRIRRSRDQWRELLNEFAESRLTREQFCQERNLALSTFDYWQRKLKREASAEQDDAIFVELTRDKPVPVQHSDQHPWDVELELGNAVVLRLRRPVC